MKINYRRQNAVHLCASSLATLYNPSASFSNGSFIMRKCDMSKVLTEHGRIGCVNTKFIN